MQLTESLHVLCQFIEKHKLNTNNDEPEKDFEGNFDRDINSAFRRRIQRVKTSETDPVEYLLRQGTEEFLSWQTWGALSTSSLLGLQQYQA